MLFVQLALLSAASTGAIASSTAEQSKSSITVVAAENFPPWMFRNAAGEQTGILKDLWSLWESRTGVKVELKALPLDDAQLAVSAGAADVIDAIAVTDEREKLFDFSAPHLKTDVVLYFSKSIAGISDANTAKGFQIGVVKGDACKSALAKAGARELKEFPTHQAMLKAAAANELTVFCAQLPVGNYFLTQLGVADQFRHSPPIYSPTGHWAVRKGNTEVFREVEAGFGKISSAEQKKIIEKWYGATVTPSLPAFLYHTAYIVGSLLVVSAGLALWNWSLRRRVAKRTADLQETLSDLRQAQAALEDRHSSLRAVLKETIASLAAAMHHRDLSTTGHAGRVCNLAVAIGRELGWTDEQLEGLSLAATVHDIGQIRVPAEILMRPRRLSKEEFDLVKLHPQTGYEILKQIPFPWPIAEVVLQHHENFDGSGYPQGLKGSQIGPGARIIRVADSFEAMMSHRPFRRALGVELAVERLVDGKGTLYDPEIVDACLRVLPQCGIALVHGEVPGTAKDQEHDTGKRSLRVG